MRSRGATWQLQASNACQVFSAARRVGGDSALQLASKCGAVICAAATPLFQPPGMHMDALCEDDLLALLAPPFGDALKIDELALFQAIVAWGKRRLAAVATAAATAAAAARGAAGGDAATTGGDAAAAGGDAAAAGGDAVAGGDAAAAAEIRAGCSVELQRTLHKLLHELRFPLMDAQTFSTHVVPTFLLTSMETTAVLVYITTGGKMSIESMTFSATKRSQALVLPQ
jgi:hypothetical protein